MDGEQDNPVESTRPERRETLAKRSTRRTFIKTGVAVAGGVILGGEYIKPTLRSISVGSVRAAQTYPPPPPDGQPSVSVYKTMQVVPGAQPGSGTASGVITVEDSNSGVNATVRTVRDTLEYRLDQNWLPEGGIPFSPEWTEGDLVPGTVIPANRRRSFPYTLQFSGIPVDAKKLSQIWHTTCS